MTEAITKIGHWLFKLERDPSSDLEVWEFQCQLCQFKTRHKVKSSYVLPLTGNLKDRRRHHDREKHPAALKEQADAELALLRSRR